MFESERQADIDEQKTDAHNRLDNWDKFKSVWPHDYAPGETSRMFLANNCKCWMCKSGRKYGKKKTIDGIPSINVNGVWVQK